MELVMGPLPGPERKVPLDVKVTEETKLAELCAREMVAVLSRFGPIALVSGFVLLTTIRREADSENVVPAVLVTREALLLRVLTASVNVAPAVSRPCGDLLRTTESPNVTACDAVRCVRAARASLEAQAGVARCDLC
jgi:hypothetical protein